MTKSNPSCEPSIPVAGNPITTSQKRQYRRRSITTGPGTKLVMEQEQKLAEARKIARAMNDVATMSHWGLDQIQAAISARLELLVPE
jgi:hypothetical protein